MYIWISTEQVYNIHLVEWQWIVLITFWLCSKKQIIAFYVIIKFTFPRLTGTQFSVPIWAGVLYNWNTIFLLGEESYSIFFFFFFCKEPKFMTSIEVGQGCLSPMIMKGLSGINENWCLLIHILLRTKVY